MTSPEGRVLRGHAKFTHFAHSPRGKPARLFIVKILSIMRPLHTAFPQTSFTSVLLYFIVHSEIVRRFPTLPHAVIEWSDDGGSMNMAIPVLNFPEIPPGSHVQWTVGEGEEEVECVFEIVAYAANNKFGTLIAVEGCWGLTWEEVLKLCVVDPTNRFNYVYPKWVDFGKRFELPSE